MRLSQALVGQRLSPSWIDEELLRSTAATPLDETARTQPLYEAAKEEAFEPPQRSMRSLGSLRSHSTPDSPAPIPNDDGLRVSPADSQRPAITYRYADGPAVAFDTLHPTTHHNNIRPRPPSHTPVTSSSSTRSDPAPYRSSSSQRHVEQIKPLHHTSHVRSHQHWQQHPAAPWIGDMYVGADLLHRSALYT
eukprot:GHVU01193870.1.p1 GENE.GHVU01193870.1~~GHVU01193870.1.p1  ORF type:complete len:192 (-),score=13.37 GHVU01193870.1:719-1294(-)